MKKELKEKFYKKNDWIDVNGNPNEIITEDNAYIYGWLTGYYELNLFSEEERDNGLDSDRYTKDMVHDISIGYSDGCDAYEEFCESNSE